MLLKFLKKHRENSVRKYVTFIGAFLFYIQLFIRTIIMLPANYQLTNSFSQHDPLTSKPINFPRILEV